MSDKKETQHTNSSTNKAKNLNIEGYPIEGLSIGGHETCIIFSSLNVAFDIGRCPLRAVSQDFLLISHSHMDHIVSVFFPYKILSKIIFFLNFELLNYIFCIEIIDLSAIND